MENSMGGVGISSDRTMGPCIVAEEKERAGEENKRRKKRAVKGSPTIEFDEEMETDRVGLSPQLDHPRTAATSTLFGCLRSVVKSRWIVGLIESTWKLDEGLTAR